MGRRVRACVPCHERKVRCDAIKVGTPCSRCVDTERTSLCIMLHSHSRHRRNPAAENTHSVPKRAVVRGHLSPSATPPYMFLSHQSPVSDSNSTIRSPGHDIASVSDQSTLPAQYLGLVSHPTHTDSTDQALDDRQIITLGHEQPLRVDSASAGGYTDAMALRDGTNPINILTEALGSAASESLASNGPATGGSWMPTQTTPTSPTDVDTEFLRQKGAFSLPPRHVCDKLLSLFFDKVYIAMPVIDRVDFVQDYWQQPAPTFVMQSVLASAVPHAPIEILKAAGFSDRASAQEAFFTRAKLLHDFDIEKRMLQRLQGSLILSVTHVSHYMQCDHRYWFSNATCIAARMGLHRIMRHEGADSSTKVLRRIWWLMYTWDVLLALNGMNTMRRFHDADSDVPHLVEDDWEDERLPDGQTMLLPISRLEKLYMIQSCKLSLLISRFWVKVLDSQAELSCDDLEVTFRSWRQSFTAVEHTDSEAGPSTISSWHLTLLARGYVCECILYRMMTRRRQPVSSPSDGGVRHRLYRTLFELDTTIDRVMNQNSGQFNTWLFHTCISTAIALHIERSLSTSTSSFDKVLSILRIQVMLEFLREMAKTWPYIGCFVTLFEAVIRSTSLSISLPGQQPDPADALPSPDSLGLQNLGWKGVSQDINSWPLGSDASVAFDIPSGPFDANSILDELFSENFQSRLF
ncbi:hypothetical protein BJY01DRAFT_227244 [Aspergillus pseudoustus]|uniref:Zn(2)-C6 fungal-type domain-containing protein n=1 Tax=Aspergillus pseudoustus TaxID=1810923 RepID=A0ABR4IRK4_9EURO